MAITGAVKILVVHGPNLNLLGTREPHLYGTTTLAELDADLVERGRGLGATVTTFQSNVEGEIVTRIQQAKGACDGIIINPAAYTHTSVAVRDALEAVALPAIEVHLTNLHKREPFRRESMTAPVCVGTIMGLGPIGYGLALHALVKIVKEKS
jgi:3-dehydroquinate dehydratase II